MFENAAWIWNGDGRPDAYAEFCEVFSYTEGRATMALSVDGDFALYLNGYFVRAGQYPDLPQYKAVERVDLAPFCRVGENDLRLIVHHPGLSDASTYYPAAPGAIYEITLAKDVIASRAGAPCRTAAGYRSGYNKRVTHQLGVSFFYDANDAGGEFFPAERVEKDCCFIERPVAPLTVGEPVFAAPIGGGIYDLGRESVGWPVLCFDAAAAGTVTVVWGEHLNKNGRVPRCIGDRDFSYEYRARAGRNVFESPFLRLGCRYLEIAAEVPLEGVQVGIRPVSYPVAVRAFCADSPRRQRIYDTAVHTLRCCMHDHYEDCPWREQALYACDSRNQMLCGYYAFGEYDFALGSLQLFAAGQRPDGHLPICVPAGTHLSIPSFTLIFARQVWEYEQHSGRTAPSELYAAVGRILDTFEAAVGEDGLLRGLPYPFWNFYEWTEGSDNAEEIGRRPDDPYCPRTDFLLNAMFLYAEEAYAGLREATPRGFDPAATRAAMRRLLRSDKMPRLSDATDVSSELAAAMGLLVGVYTDEEQAAVAARLAAPDNGLVGASLSMKIFVYEALLAVDPGYRDFVLDDLDACYGRMLDAGATSFWETEEGAAAFGDAGSLCHGWSALPAYYYAKLGVGKYRGEIL